jgi:hypothetical protein
MPRETSSRDAAQPPIRSPDALKCPGWHFMATWVWPLALRGARRPLQADDVPDAPRVVQSEPLHSEAEALWAEQLAVPPERGGPRLMPAIMSGATKRFIREGVVLSSISGLCASVGRPLLLRAAVVALTNDTYSWGAGMCIAAALSLVIWLENWLKLEATYRSADRGAMRCVSCAMQLVTVKCLRVRAGAAPEGKESQLLGADLIGVFEFTRFLCGRRESNPPLYLPRPPPGWHFLGLRGLVGTSRCRPLLSQSITSLVGGITVLLVITGPIGLVGVAIAYHAIGPMLCYAMLCYAVLCYAMLCYAMLCYAVLCYAMLC